MRRAAPPPKQNDAPYLLQGPQGPYRSARPGLLGGYRPRKIFGDLDCASALRAIERGGYVAQRVFFADQAAAEACGYRPCAKCMPELYRRWKAEQTEASQIVSVTVAEPTLRRRRGP